MTTEPTASESARHLLDRHGLPEDVVDGALCLHAQELAAVQRREAAVWGVDTAAGKHILGAADLIDPTRAAAVPVPPSAGIDRRAQLLDALDFAYCQGLGFDTPEALLDAYDVSCGVPVPPPADQTALLLRAADFVGGLLLTRTSITAAELEAELRRMAAEEQPAETQWPGERCMLCPPDTRTRHLEDHMVQVHGARPTAQPAVGEQPETQEAQHLGGRANAEDCPGCKAERRNLPYPFLCPGPDTP